MTYEIKIEFHPLYELVSSMAVFANPKPDYDLDKKWFQILESKVAFCDRWPRINGIQSKPIAQFLWQVLPGRKQKAESNWSSR